MAGIDRSALEEEGVIKETSRIHAHSIFTSYLPVHLALQLVFDRHVGGCHLSGYCRRREDLVCDVGARVRGPQPSTLLGGLGGIFQE